MELNTTTLRGILAQITSVNEKYIVPKQGNWWNPQENQANIKNWCAYRIKNNTPRTAPFYVKETTGNATTNQATVQKLATIELQFVGPDSEDLAQSVAFWNLREDVKTAFEAVRGAVMYDTKQAISSVFYQEGLNTVTAWNVEFQVLWYSQVPTGQGSMPRLILEGKIKNK